MLRRITLKNGRHNENTLVRFTVICKSEKSESRSNALSNTFYITNIVQYFTRHAIYFYFTKMSECDKKRVKAENKDNSLCASSISGELR